MSNKLRRHFLSCWSQMMAVLWRQVVVAWEQCALYKVAVNLWVLKEACLLLYNVPRAMWVQWELQPWLPLPALWKVIQQIASEWFGVHVHVHNYNIALSGMICYRLLAEASGAEVIVKLLTDAVAEARQFASDCITSMAPDGNSIHWCYPIIDNNSFCIQESLRCQLETAGAVDSLIGCLSFPDSAVQASSVEALGMLCCNASSRQQVLSCFTPGVCIYSHPLMWFPPSSQCLVVEYLLCFSCYTLLIRT